MSQDEKCVLRSWNILNQDEAGWNSVFHGHETLWIKMSQDERVCFMVIKHLESGLVRMKQCVSWSWNTFEQDETVRFTVMKDLESGWIRMTLRVSWPWNTLFHGNETPWIKSSYHTDILIAMLITNLWPWKLRVSSGKKKLYSSITRYHTLKPTRSLSITNYLASCNWTISEN